ncbi:MAG: class I SAM-dependent methyltransferase [Vulcanibacillus sp.]
MSIIINQIIKTVIRYPWFMETALFKKTMFVFPNMIANRYDKTVGNRVDYELPLIEGLKYLDLDARFEGKILDLCTGTGFASLEAAAVFPKAKIIGIDQSQTMLDLASQKADSRNIDNAEFIMADASHLFFKEDSFDLVIVSNAPFYFEEIARVLKTTGSFLISLSFGGKSIVQSRKRIEEYFQQYNLKVKEIKQVKEGVFILSSLDK